MVKLITSLIDKFLYPKFGPGQMWEKVAETVSNKGTQLHLNHKVIKLKTMNCTPGFGQLRSK
ncbi:MAG: hypothetical protein A2Y25_10110 [Candidatus Melainabacteria bacterium GWF2_37_15]|nr:MAG: hypothetical protein A2Y25_10110 [Candidatus Melainabacteria bacterium GWF2_37_15]